MNKLNLPPLIFGLSFVVLINSLIVNADVIQINMTQLGNYRDGYISGASANTTHADSLRVGDNGVDTYWRSFIDFNTSLIPDGSAINSISIQLIRFGAANTGTITVYGLENVSTSFTNANLLAACGGGIGSEVYNHTVTLFQGITKGNISLNSNATQNLSAQLDDDFFSICLSQIGDALLPNLRTDFNSSEAANVDSHPTIFVNYTSANTAPAINNVTCYNSTSPVTCNNITYLSNLTVISVNCSDADSNAANVSFVLYNANDRKYLINANATINTSQMWNYTANMLINDSGNFTLNVTCYDNAASTLNTTEWIIPFGSLNSTLRIASGGYSHAASTAYVKQNQWFQAKMNLTCLRGECGDVNASLDPAPAEATEPKLNLTKLMLFLLLFLALFCVIFFKLNLSMENKFIVASVLAILIFTLYSFTASITGFAAGMLVNTTAGATPHYTNGSNPMTPANLSCLADMKGNSQCEVSWDVMATGELNNISEFWAFANATNYTLSSNETQHINVMIKSCDVGGTCSLTCFSGSTYDENCNCAGGTPSCSGGGGGSIGSTRDETSQQTTETTKETTETKETTPEQIQEQMPEQRIENIIKLESKELSETELNQKMKEILQKFYKTQENTKVDKTFVYNKTKNLTEIKYEIVPIKNATLLNYTFYIDINKCAALYADMVAFKEDYKFDVIVDDPLFKLSFEEVKEPLIIKYEVNGEVLEYCKNLLATLGIAETILEPPTPKALLPLIKTHEDVLKSYKGLMLSSLPLFIFSFLIILIAAYLYEKSEITHTAKARKLKRMLGLGIVDIALIVMIVGNVAEMSGMLPDYFSLFEKAVGIFLATYILYKINIPNVVLGVKSKALNIVALIAFYLVTASAFLGIGLSEPNQLLAALTEYLAQNTNLIILAGVYSIAALSLCLAVFSKIQKPSLMSTLKQDGNAKNIFQIMYRFALISLIFLICSYVLFKPVVEWTALAIEAPPLMIGLCVFILFALKNYKIITMQRIVERPIEKIAAFFHKMEFKKKIMFTVSGLLALNILVDIFVFLLPNKIYIEEIALAGHKPFVTYLMQELPSALPLSKFTLAYAYLFNALFMAFVLAMPVVIWYYLLANKKFVFNRTAAALFFSSFMAYMIMPVYSIARLTDEKVIGADIRTRSLLHSDFLIKQFTSTDAALIILVISSIIAGILAYLLYKNYSNHISAAMVFTAMLFFAVHLYFYISSTWAYALSILTEIAGKPVFDKAAGIAKSALLFAASAVYLAAFYLFGREIFSRFRKRGRK